ncbi:low molecular weight phosphatase family protein [Corynebacterium testudinoris]|uniref:Protein-tyrosine-phosphatase n=1 Tax=Corynebacterium testudinoris TaxID=136857 RepID=A0A0G3HFH1_9CORY|nr:low molecular weight phosphatase family protein [Corynebacterium testudinoris]AKK09892.1 protein-tyrosine-phosphatase [Corynebacterium testudinoris]MBX8996378.1 low molecular weight phosphatase family protein [Corynebacterium testudinoris]
MGTTNDRYAIVREDMHRRYGQYFYAGTIDDLVDRTIAEAEARAKIDTFLPVIVEREVSEELETRAEAAGRSGTARPEVLFVCERNAGRSQLASAIMNQAVGDRVFVRSVGLNPTGGIDPQVIEVLEERGIPNAHLYQKEIVPRTVHRSSVIVLMGVDELPGIPGDRIEHWDIADPAGKSLDEVRAIADDIESHVRELVVELGKSNVNAG